jgi:hypothetical protein
MKPFRSRSRMHGRHTPIAAAVAVGGLLWLPSAAAAQPTGAAPHAHPPAAGQATATPRCLRRLLLLPAVTASDNGTQRLLTDEALLLIRGEYLEMPGLRLTTRQAQRLWHLEHARCEVLLNVLVDTRFLVRTADGAFVRLDGNSPMGTHLAAPPRRPFATAA